MASREASDNDSDYDSDASSVMSEEKTATKSSMKSKKPFSATAVVMGENGADDMDEESVDLSEADSDLDIDDNDEDAQDDDDDEPSPDSDTEGDALNNQAHVPSRYENLFHDEDEDQDEEDDEDYLQKFDDNTRKNIIKDYYPELVQQNYDEIDVLSKVVRDTEGNIIDPLHTTLPILSKYEKTRIVGERARQINAGAAPLIQVDETIIDGYLIALKELEEKKIPFIIKRPLPNGSVEYWRITDLEVI